MLKRVNLHRTHQLVSPVKGCLLMAEPFAQDIYFSQSVVLLLDSGREGFMGLVLNKPLKMCLNHVFAKYGLENVPIYRGGPVDEKRLFYLHNVSHVDGAVEVGNDLFVGGSLEEVSERLKAEPENYSVKFFMGYTGWSSGQLESEIKNESWVVSHINIDVFGVDQGKAWRDSLLALGDDYYSMWLNFPSDPLFN